MNENLFALCSGDSLTISGHVEFTNLTPDIEDSLMNLCPPFKVFIQTGMSCYVKQLPGPYGEIRIRISDKPPEKSWTYDDLHSSSEYPNNSLDVKRRSYNDY